MISQKEKSDSKAELIQKNVENILPLEKFKVNKKVLNDLIKRNSLRASFSIDKDSAKNNKETYSINALLHPSKNQNCSLTTNLLKKLKMNL